MTEKMQVIRKCFVVRAEMFSFAQQDSPGEDC